MTSTYIPWTTACLALGITLLATYLLGRLSLGRVAHGLLALLALSGAIAIISLFHPWQSSSAWLRAVSLCLGPLAGVELARAIRNQPGRSAA